MTRLEGEQGEEAVLRAARSLGATGHQLVAAYVDGLPPDPDWNAVVWAVQAMRTAVLEDILRAITLAAGADRESPPSAWVEAIGVWLSQQDLAEDLDVQLAHDARQAVWSREARVGLRLTQEISLAHGEAWWPVLTDDPTQ